MTTNIKGQIAQSKAELRALELGIVPSKPIFDARYDLILDDGEKLQKVQIKYAGAESSKTEGVVVVSLSYENRIGTTFTYQEDEIDGLIVYIPKIDKLCFFPPHIYAGKAKLQVRIERAKTQHKTIVYAKDYFW